MDEGFLWCIPMKDIKLIKFSEILKIEILRNCCDEDSLVFLVSTEHSKILLDEVDVYDTGLQYAFFALPDFQKKLYQDALHYRFTKKYFWLEKRFLVYARAS